MKKVLILALCLFGLCGCNKKEKNWYDFVIDEIDSNEYIKCEYSKQENFGEKIIFIFEKNKQSISKSAFYFYDLTNYTNFDLNTYKNDNNCEVIEKDSGAIIVCNIKNTLSIEDEKKYHEVLGATCTEKDTN